MLKQLFNDMKKDIDGFKAFKDTIVDSLSDTVKEVDDKVSGMFESVLKAVDAKLDAFFKETEKVFDEKLKRIDEFEKSMAELKEMTENAIEQFKKDYNLEELLGDVEDVVETVGSVHDYLLKIKSENPDMFSNRVEMIKHMEEFIKEHGFGQDWFKIYKTLR